MATANANQLTIQITAAMRLGAETRSLPLASYIAQLADSDAAAIRSLRIETPLNSAFRPNLSRESSDDDDEWSPRECPTDKREKILSMLAEGIPPIAVAQRLSISTVTVYRIRAEARKKAAQSRSQRRPAQASAIAELSDDELCSEYRNGTPIATLAARFKLAPCAISAELRRRGVAIRKTGPRLGKLGWTPHAKKGKA
jgi:transposase